MEVVDASLSFSLSKKVSLLNHVVSLGCKIGAEGACALASALTTNRALRELRVEFADVGNVGAGSLLTALEHKNSTLATLRLRGNHLDDCGVVSIFDPLSRHKGLTSLNVEQCKLGNQSVRALAGALAHNGALKELMLSHNDAIDGTSSLLGQNDIPHFSFLSCR